MSDNHTVQSHTTPFLYSKEHITAIGGIDNCNAAGEVDKKKVCYECAAGYYISEDKSLCPACLTGCSTCKDGKTCDGCKAGYFSNTVSKVCDSCSSGCSTCESGTKCTVCASDHKLTDGTCVKTTPPAEPSSNALMYIVIGVLVAAGIAAGVFFYMKKSGSEETGLYSSAKGNSGSGDNAQSDIIDARL